MQRTQDLSRSDCFDVYLLDIDQIPEAEAAGLAAYSAVAMAKRILLQEKCRDFTAADVVALAAIIESRARFELARQ